MKQSVRVLLFRASQLIVLKGKDVNDPMRPAWLYTVGGTVEDNETNIDAAIRETFEETGVKLSVTDLHGPIFEREAWRDFAVNPYMVKEVFYWANIPDGAVLSTDSWTESERQSVLSLSTFSVSELKDFRDLEGEIFPKSLPELAEKILTAETCASTFTS